MKYKRFAALVMTLAMVMSMAACGSKTTAPATESGTETSQTETAEGAKSPVKLQISTASTSGAFYNVGLAFAQTVSNHSDYMDVSAVTSAGSNENVGLLRNGETSIGCVQSDVFIDAVNGKGSFEANGPFEDLMVVLPVTAMTYHMLVQDGSDISTMADLSGKRLGIGEAGSGNAVTIQKVLTTFDLEDSDYSASAIGPTEALSALQNKQLDWMMVVSSYPASSVTEATTTGYAKVMGLTEEEQAKLLEAYPFMAARTIPAGTYPNQDEDLLAVGHTSYIAATSAMDEDVIYDFVKTIYTNLDEVYGYYGNLKTDISFTDPAPAIEELTTQGVKLHPGAERALTELGYLK